MTFTKVSDIMREIHHMIAIEINGGELAQIEMELSKNRGVPLHEGGDAETSKTQKTSKKHVTACGPGLTLEGVPEMPTDTQEASKVVTEANEGDF